jgi:nicotinamide-nucleotide amidase
LLKNKLTCAVAESCTGGLLAAAITEIPGSSQWFECGFVTYSNQAKHAFLDVPKEIIVQYGAVSEETVLAMTAGVENKTKVDLTVAISGIAGPGGGSILKPVGTVWIAYLFQGNNIAQHHLFTGDRSAIRQQAVNTALENMLKQIRWHGALA